MQTHARNTLALAFTSLAFASAVTGRAAQADDYPSRPIHLIVPYAAGGAADSMARVIAKRVGSALGQTIVVENRGGGGSIIGTEFVNKVRTRRLHAAARTIRADFHQPRRLQEPALRPGEGFCADLD